MPENEFDLKFPVIFNEFELKIPNPFGMLFKYSPTKFPFLLSKYEQMPFAKLFVKKAAKDDLSENNIFPKPFFIFFLLDFVM